MVENLHYEESLDTIEHHDRIEHVLKFYRLEYERTGDVSLVLKEPIDLDLMWNFTSKAENKEWLKTHERN